MLPTLVYTPTFLHWWKNMDLDDSDLRELEQVLIEAPAAGPIMSGTGGLRKIRFAPRSLGRGKSGGLRVCYAWFEDLEMILVVLAFTKNVRANLNGAEKTQVRDYLKAARQSFLRRN